MSATVQNSTATSSHGDAVEPEARQERFWARRETWAFAASTAFLSLATYLYMGYRFNVWPQPGFLGPVARYSGDLKNDWYTSLPAANWALDHTLGLLPHSALPAAVAVLWVLALVALWWSILALGVTLGASLAAGVGAGLVLIPTGLGGFGVSETLAGYFYPNALAYALSIGGVVLLLRETYRLAGAIFGVAILVHPGLGPLSLVLAAPLLLVAHSRARAALNFGVPLVIIGGPAVVQVLLGSASGGSLSRQQTFDFLAIVRTPHHMTYSFFPAVEWIRTALWTSALLAGLIWLRRRREARLMLLVLVAIVAACLAGAFSSAHGWPLLVFEVQTSRLSSYAIVFGAVAAAAAMSQVAPGYAAAVLAVIFVIAPRALAEFLIHVPSFGTDVALSAAEAALVLLALAAFALVALAGQKGVGVKLPIPVAAGFAGLAVAAVSLMVLHPDRVPQTLPQDAAYSDVADRAHAMVPSGTLAITPPELDGFRSTALLPDVVEFGTVRLGAGDAEWARRMLALTRNPAVLNSEPIGTDVQGRAKVIGDSYQRVMATTRDPICRYGARLVVTHAGLRRPAWLKLAYRNVYFELYTVRPSTCTTRH